jgi:hypothetical protein
MHVIRRPRPSRALLALVFCLALLGPGAAGRAATGADAPRSLAGPADGLEQGLLRDLPGQSLVPGAARDGRDRPGPAAAGVLAAGLAAAGAWAAASRRTARPARRRAAAAAGARAPPSRRPTPI